MTTSTHEDQAALSWFVRVSDPDASEETWLEFRCWLEIDPSHAEAYDRIERVWTLMDKAGADAADAVTPPAANDDRPMVRSTLTTRGRIGPTQRWIAPLLATAAATVLIVGLWPEISGAGRFRTYSTDDTMREVVLSDGSRLSMNRHSELKARVGSRGREVLLNGGEVAFDVTHDARRPFVVAADAHQIRVLGTAFNVLDHDGQFSVAVQRGRVAVSGEGFSEAKPLAAGQRLYQDGNATPVVSKIDPAETSGWRQGVLIYRDADLSTVAKDLSRYLDKPVRISPSDSALRFTGALRIGDETTMLRQVQDFMRVRAVQEDEGLRLTARDGG